MSNLSQPSVQDAQSIDPRHQTLANNTATPLWALTSAMAVATTMTACTTTITTADAARFLQQAQFSANEADIAQVMQLGYEGWLDQQLAMPIATRGWNWMYSQGYLANTFKFDTRPLDHMMWHQLITAKDTLRKRVALALSEIFVVSIEGMNGEFPAATIAAYWDILNSYAFGSYRSLLTKITYSLAMGRYLSARGSKKEDLTTGRRPDENFARELLQLFSVGLHKLNLDGTLMRDATGKPIETYTQSQITELARIFTGFEEDRSTSTDTLPNFTRLNMKIVDADHAFSAAKVFNRTIAAGTSAASAIGLALGEISIHPNVAPFISKQLIQRLVCSNPTPAYVARVATVFNKNAAGVRGDLKSVITAILMDAEARQSPNLNAVTNGKVREPMLRLVQWARTFNATSVSGKWLIGDMSSSQWRMAQSPFRAGSVFNFFKPDFATSALAAQNCVAPELQLIDESSVAAYVNFTKDMVDKGLPRYDDWRINELIPNYGNELALVSTPAALVARLNLLLCANQLSAATQTLILNAVASIATTKPDWQKNRVWCAVLLVMASPEYQVQK